MLYLLLTFAGAGLWWWLRTPSSDTTGQDFSADVCASSIAADATNDIDQEMWALGKISMMAPLTSATAHQIIDGRHHDAEVINPASGLAMIGGIGGIDEEGNAYGCSWDDFSSSSSFFDDSWANCPAINPANGLPMIGDSGFDIEGNPYGFDFHNDSLSCSAFDTDNVCSDGFGSSWD